MSSTVKEEHTFKERILSALHIWALIMVIFVAGCYRQSIVSLVYSLMSFFIIFKRPTFTKNMYFITTSTVTLIISTVTLIFTIFCSIFRMPVYSYIGFYEVKSLEDFFYNVFIDILVLIVSVITIFVENRKPNRGSSPSIPSIETPQTLSLVITIILLSVCFVTYQALISLFVFVPLLYLIISILSKPGYEKKIINNKQIYILYVVLSLYYFLTSIYYNLATFINADSGSLVYSIFGQEIKQNGITFTYFILNRLGLFLSLFLLIYSKLYHNPQHQTLANEEDKEEEDFVTQSLKLLINKGSKLVSSNTPTEHEVLPSHAPHKDSEIIPMENHQTPIPLSHEEEYDHFPTLQDLSRSPVPTSSTQPPQMLRSRSQSNGMRSQRRLNSANSDGLSRNSSFNSSSVENPSTVPLSMGKKRSNALDVTEKSTFYSKSTSTLLKEEALNQSQFYMDNNENMDMRGDDNIVSNPFSSLYEGQESSSKSTHFFKSFFLYFFEFMISFIHSPFGTALYYILYMIWMFINPTIFTCFFLLFFIWDVHSIYLSSTDETKTFLEYSKEDKTINYRSLHVNHRTRKYMLLYSAIPLIISYIALCLKDLNLPHSDIFDYLYILTGNITNKTFNFIIQLLLFALCCFINKAAISKISYLSYKPFDYAVELNMLLKDFLYICIMVTMLCNTSILALIVQLSFIICNYLDFDIFYYYINNIVSFVVFVGGVVLDYNLSETYPMFSIFGVDGLYQGGETTLNANKYYIEAALVIVVTWKVLLCIYCNDFKHDGSDSQSSLSRPRSVLFWKLTYNQLHGMIPLVLILKILLYKPTILNNVLIFFFLFYVIIFYTSKTEWPTLVYLCIFLFFETIIFGFKYMTCLMPIYQLMEYHFHIKDVIHAGLGELYPTEIGIYIYADGEGQLGGIQSVAFFFFDVLLIITLLYRIDYMRKDKYYSDKYLPDMNRINYIHNIHSKGPYKFFFLLASHFPKLIILCTLIYICYNPSLLNLIIVILMLIHLVTDFNVEHQSMTVNKTREMPYFTSRWLNLDKFILIPLMIIGLLRYTVQYDGFDYSLTGDYETFFHFLGLDTYTIYDPSSTTKDYIIFGKYYGDVLHSLLSSIGFYIIIPSLLLFQSTFLEYIVNVHNLFIPTITAPQLNAKRQRSCSLGAIIFPIDGPDIFEYVENLAIDNKSSRHNSMSSISSVSSEDSNSNPLFLSQVAKNKPQNSIAFMQSQSFRHANDVSSRKLLNESKYKQMTQTSTGELHNIDYITNFKTPPPPPSSLHLDASELDIEDPTSPLLENVNDQAIVSPQPSSFEKKGFFNNLGSIPEQESPQPSQRQGLLTQEDLREFTKQEFDYTDSSSDSPETSMVMPDDIDTKALHSISSDTSSPSSIPNLPSLSPHPSSIPYHQRPLTLPYKMNQENLLRPHNSVTSEVTKPLAIPRIDHGDHHVRTFSQSTNSLGLRSDSSRTQSMDSSSPYIDLSDAESKKHSFMTISGVNQFIYKYTDFDIKEQSQYTLSLFFNTTKYFFINFFEFLLENSDILLRYFYIILLFSYTGISDVSALFWFMNIFISVFLPNGVISALLNVIICFCVFFLEYTVYTFSIYVDGDPYYLLSNLNYPSLFCASIVLYLSVILLYVEYCHDSLHIEKDESSPLMSSMSSMPSMKRINSRMSTPTVNNQLPVSFSSTRLHSMDRIQVEIDVKKKSMYSPLLCTYFVHLNPYSKFILKLDSTIPIMRNLGLSHFYRGYLKNTKSNKLFKKMITFICDNIHLITIICLFLMSLQQYDLIHFIYFIFTMIFLTTGTIIKSPRTVSFQTLKWYSYLALLLCCIYQIPNIPDMAKSGKLLYSILIGLRKYDRFCGPQNSVDDDCVTPYSLSGLLPIIIVNIMLYTQQLVQGSKFYLNIKKEIEAKHSVIGDEILSYFISKWTKFSINIKNLYPQMKDYLKYIREIVERYPLTIQYDQDSNLHAELYILNGYAVQIRLYNNDESPYFPNYSESILVYIYEIDNATKKELMVRKVVLPVYTIHNKEDSASGTLQKDLRYSFAMLTSLSPSRQYRLELYGTVDAAQLEKYYRFHPVPFISIHKEPHYLQPCDIYEIPFENRQMSNSSLFRDLNISQSGLSISARFGEHAYGTRAKKIIENTSNDSTLVRSIQVTMPSSGSNISFINNMKLECDSRDSRFVHLFSCYYTRNAHVYPLSRSKNYKYCKFYINYDSRQIKIVSVNSKGEYGSEMFFSLNELFSFYKVKLNSSEDINLSKETNSFKLFDYIKAKRENQFSSPLTAQNSVTTTPQEPQDPQDQQNPANDNILDTFKLFEKIKIDREAQQGKEQPEEEEENAFQEAEQDDYSMPTRPKLTKFRNANGTSEIKKEFILGFTNAMEQTEYLYLINPENPNIPETSGDNIMKILEYLLPIQAKIIKEPQYKNILNIDSQYDYPYRKLCLYLCKHYGYDEREILLSVIYTLTLVITSLYITIHPSVFGYLLAVVSFSYGFLYGLPLSGTFINVLSYMTMAYCIIKYFVQFSIIEQVVNEQGHYALQFINTERHNYAALNFQPLFISGLYKVNMKCPAFSSLLWDGLFLLLLYTIKNLMNVIGLYHQPLHKRIREYVVKHKKNVAYHKTTIKQYNIWQKIYMSINDKSPKFGEYISEMFPDLYMLFLKSYGHDSDHTYKQGKNKSVYSFLIQTVILIYIILFFSTMVSVSYYDVTEVIQQSFFDTNTVIMTIIHIATMIIDRYLYVTKNLELKVIYQMIYTVCVMYFIFISVPLTVKNNFFSNIYLVVFFILQILYLCASTEQIRSGYPRLINHFYEIIENNYSSLKRLIFLTYKSIPFIYLIHQVLDWICTVTSLDIWNWFELEDIRYKMFYSKSVMKAYDQSDYYKCGTKQTTASKFIYGLSSTLVLILVLIIPIVLFSKDMPLLTDNPLITSSTQIQILFNGESFPLYVNTNNVVMQSPSEETFETWQKLFVNVNNQTTLSSSWMSQSQIVLFSNYSESIWNPPTPVLNRLKTIMTDSCTSVAFSVSYTFTRGDSSTTPSLSGDYKQYFNESQCRAFKRLLDEDDPSNYLDIPNLYPRLYRATSSSLLVMDQDPTKYNSLRLSLEHLTSNSTANQYLWYVRTHVNTDVDIQGISQVASKTAAAASVPRYIYRFFEERKSEEYEDGVQFWIINEKVFPQYISKSLESLGTLTIYAFYIYIVYTCSNVISMLFLPTESYLNLSSIEDASIMLVLVHSVYIAREDSINGNLYDEITLFKLLKRIYRSPELIYQLTKHKPNYLAIQYFSDVVRDENIPASYDSKNDKDASPYFLPNYVHKTYNNDICPIDVNIKSTLLQQSFYPQVIVAKIDPNDLDNSSGSTKFAVNSSYRDGSLSPAQQLSPYICCDEQKQIIHDIYSAYFANRYMPFHDTTYDKAVHLLFNCNEYSSNLESIDEARTEVSPVNSDNEVLEATPDEIPTSNDDYMNDPSIHTYSSQF